MNTRRMVLDTNVIVSALLSPSGSPAKVYSLFINGEHELLYSDSILVEYQDVLSRTHLAIDADDASKVIDGIRNHGVCISPEPGTVTLIDEDDRVFYDIAKSSGAYLVTGNLRHYPKESFIVSPREYLDL